MENKVDWMLKRAEVDLRAAMKGKQIPQRMRDGIERYVLYGVPNGGFLDAVFKDQLSEAFGRADGENQLVMKQYVLLMYNDLPVGCWGSKESVKQWTENGGLKGLIEKRIERDQVEVSR